MNPVQKPNQWLIRTLLSQLVCKTQRNLELNYFLFSNMASFFYYYFIFIFILFYFYLLFFLGVQGPSPMPQLDFGLWARISQRFLPTLSPRSIFPPGARFPLPKHVTSGFQSLPVPVMWLSVTSGSHDVISGHVTSAWVHDPYGPWFPLLGVTQQPIRSLASKRGQVGHMGAPYYWRHSYGSPQVPLTRTWTKFLLKLRI